MLNEAYARVAESSNMRALADAAGCGTACQLWWSNNLLTGQTRFVHTDGEESSHLTVDPYVDAHHPYGVPDTVREWLRGLHK